VTALIHPRGTILAEVWDAERKSYQYPGFISGELELCETKITFYTRWGDWMVWVSMGLVFVGLIRFRDVA
jgi:apolipoprotein N-acyltransferase